MQVIGTVLACLIAYFGLSEVDIAPMSKALLVGTASVAVYVVLGKSRLSGK